MNWPTAGIIVAMISGLTGTGLGIFNVVTSQREKRRRVVVTLEGSLALQATNPGYRTVLLQDAGLLLPNGHMFVYNAPRLGVNATVVSPYGASSVTAPEDNHSLPYHLQEGHNHVLSKSPYALAEAMRGYGVVGKVQIRGFYRDALGTVYKSKLVTFDTEEWPSQVEEST